MEKLIVKNLCTKYEKSGKLIKLMLRDLLKEGYKVKEAVELIEKFYNEKSMQ